MPWRHYYIVIIIIIDVQSSQSVTVFNMILKMCLFTCQSMHLTMYMLHVIINITMYVSHVTINS